jgi:hypothetical protein
MEEISGVLEDVLSKTRENFSQDRRCPGRDLNEALRERHPIGSDICKKDTVEWNKIVDKVRGSVNGSEFPLGQG